MICLASFNLFFSCVCVCGRHLDWLIYFLLVVRLWECVCVCGCLLDWLLSCKSRPSLFIHNWTCARRLLYRVALIAEALVCFLTHGRGHARSTSPDQKATRLGLPFSLVLSSLSVLCTGGHRVRGSRPSSASVYPWSPGRLPLGSYHPLLLFLLFFSFLLSFFFFCIISNSTHSLFFLSCRFNCLLLVGRPRRRGLVGHVGYPHRSTGLDFFFWFFRPYQLGFWSLFLLLLTVSTLHPLPDKKNR